MGNPPLLKLAGDWLSKCRPLEFNQKKSSRFAWAWVRENGRTKGSHVHILLHLPTGTQIGTMQRRWLRLVTGRPYSASTIKTVRIGGTASAAQSAPAGYRPNLAAVVAYLLKGTCPIAGRELSLETGAWRLDRREAGRDKSEHRTRGAPEAFTKIVKSSNTSRNFRIPYARAQA